MLELTFSVIGTIFQLPHQGMSHIFAWIAKTGNVNVAVGDDNVGAAAVRVLTVRVEGCT
jgi:hypothetical protein